MCILTCTHVWMHAPSIAPHGHQVSCCVRACFVIDHCTCCGINAQMREAEACIKHYSFIHTVHTLYTHGTHTHTHTHAHAHANMHARTHAHSARTYCIHIKISAQTDPSYNTYHTSTHNFLISVLPCSAVLHGQV